jgi:hypothetical protein
MEHVCVSLSVSLPGDTDGCGRRCGRRCELRYRSERDLSLFLGLYVTGRYCICVYEDIRSCFPRVGHSTLFVVVSATVVIVASWNPSPI